MLYLQYVKLAHSAFNDCAQSKDTASLHVTLKKYKTLDYV